MHKTVNKVGFNTQGKYISGNSFLSGCCRKFGKYKDSFQKALSRVYTFPIACVSMAAGAVLILRILSILSFSERSKR